MKFLARIICRISFAWGIIYAFQGADIWWVITLIAIGAAGGWE